MSRILRVLSCAVLALLTASCGFQLRHAQPLHFHRLYLEANAGQPFTIELRRALEALPGLELLNAPKDAEIRVQIQDDHRERVILSLTTAGRVRELTLRQRVRFQAFNQAGEPLLAPTDLAVERVLSFNDSATLAKDAEEAQIYRDMQSDSVRLLMLRLAALKPDSKPAEGS